MKTAKAFLICATLVAFTGIGMASSVTAGENVKTSGLITGRSGEDMTVRANDMGNIVVVLTGNTVVEEPKGKLHLRHTQMGVTALTPGLPIKLEGTGNAKGQVTANKITFSADDLRTANEIQAGLVPTEHNVAANKEATAGNAQAIASNQQEIAANKAENQQEIQDVNKRFSELNDYDTKDTATLYYAPGASQLDAKQKAELEQLAHKAVNLQGYIVQVKGFTDSSGNAVFNQKLSQERATNAIAYLEQQGNVPLRNIVAPGAMGETDPVESNETAQGRAENRRVVVKVLVNKGIAGQ